MNIKTIEAAQERIRPFLSPTPLLFSSLLKREFNKNVWLKLETQNPTGSFKPRPAFNSILSKLEEAKECGVIASSSGNFAQGVAFAAAKLGISALIVMTESTSPYKIKRTKKLGAEVVLSADTHEARIELTNELQKNTGRLLLHPYDSEATIAGDGTVGLELREQLGNELANDTTILVPVSGGGLIAGIALAIKHYFPHCKIIGVQSTVSGTLKKSLQTGSIVNVGKFKTIADALVASTLGTIPFEIIKKYVDDALVIEEAKIKNATQFMLEQHKLVVEPAAALPIAALIDERVGSKNIVCVITGGNIDLPLFFSATKQE